MRIKTYDLTVYYRPDGAEQWLSESYSGISRVALEYFKEWYRESYFEAFFHTA